MSPVPSASSARWRRLCAALLLAQVRCDPAPLDSPSRPRCASPDDAPLRNAAGSPEPFACVAVGARDAPAGAEWPTAPPGAGTVVWVSASASPGGDGSRARPHRELGEALASLRGAAGEVRVARGRYRVVGTLALHDGTSVVGAGPGAVVLVASRGRAAWRVGAGRAGLRGLTLRFEDGDAADEDVAVHAAPGAELAADDLRVEAATVGLDVEGATLRAARVTVVGAALAGIRLRAGSRALVASSRIHHGARHGLHAIDSTLHLDEVWITCNGIAGVTVEGAPRAGAGSARCEGDPLAAPGGSMCWRRVTLEENKLVAVDVAVCRDDTVACARGVGAITLDARRVAVLGTGSLAGRGGDGVSVGPRARVTFDPDMTEGASGGGSWIAGSARAGLLVTGPEAVVSARGLRVEGNVGAGVYAQAAARLEVLRDGLVAGNGAVGIGVTPSSSLGVVARTRVLGTTAAPLGGTGPVLGDGVALSQRAGAVLTENFLADNARFAAFLTGIDDATLRANSGAGNRFGMVAYDSRVDPSVGNSVGAREAAPPRAPTGLTDAMSMR